MISLMRVKSLRPTSSFTILYTELKEKGEGRGEGRAKKARIRERGEKKRRTKVTKFRLNLGLATHH